MEERTGAGQGRIDEGGKGGDRRSWILIAIAGLSLALGVVAVVIALNAKSTSDDAATADSVQAVQQRLNRLIDRLGVAEGDLSGRESQTQQRISKLSGRLNKVEKQVRSLQASVDSTANLDKKVSTLETRTSTQAGEIQSLQRQVDRLERQVSNLQG